MCKEEYRLLMHAMEDLHETDEKEWYELNEQYDKAKKKDMDGAEFVLCDICMNNRNGSCLKNNSAATEHPTEMYFDICKLFSPRTTTPITPYQFEKLMIRMRDRSINDTDDGFDAKRYNMEYMMCVMLEMLGYGAGARIFLNEACELPF